MALFAKDEKNHGPAAGGGRPTAQSPARPAERRSTIEAQLGTGTEIEGKLTFKGSVRIDGKVVGEIHVGDTVEVGESADISAQINASTVITQGKIRGDIIATKRVELRAPATVIGNINTPSLVVHEGVLFEGRCTMGKSKDGRADGTDTNVAIFPTEERAAATRRKSEAAS